MPAVAALIVHLIVGPLFDYVRAKKVFSVTVIRKIFHVIGIHATSMDNQVYP